MTTVSARPESGVAPFARGPVLAITVAVGAVLTAVSGRYGYFGDELYFLAAGHHLSWGYADQPPLLPLLALLADTVAPGHVTVLRIPATLAAMAVVVLGALLARELGGNRRAQVVSSATVAVSPAFLANGHYLATSTFDPLLWVLLTWLLVRWLRTRADGLLVWAGVVTALALQVKFLVVGFWAVAIVALLVLGPRRLLTRPALWLGGVIAVVATIPTLLWQATHGWPQLAMTSVIAAESEYTGGRPTFLPLALVLTGGLVGTVLGLHGLWRLLRGPELRWLGATALGIAALFLLTGGRPYYVAGMFPLLWAASAVAVGDRSAARWWRWVATWPVFGLTVVALGVVNILPVAPVASHAGKPIQYGNFQLDEIGWPRTVAGIRALAGSLPAGTVVVSDSYWVTAAVQHYAPEIPAYGYSRGPGYWDIPPDGPGPVLYTGDPAALAPWFAQVTRVGTLDNGVRVANLTQGTPVYLLEGRKAPWAEIWRQVRHL